MDCSNSAYPEFSQYIKEVNPGICLRKILVFSNKSEYCFCIIYKTITDVKVKAMFEDGNGHSFNVTGQTDSLGHICLESIYSSRLDLIEATKEGYVYQCRYGNQNLFNNNLTNYIRLRLVAYMKLHIKNVPPNSGTDNIYISHSDSYCNGISYLNELHGSIVDTKCYCFLL